MLRRVMAYVEYVEYVAYVAYRRLHIYPVYSLP